MGTKGRPSVGTSDLLSCPFTHFSHVQKRPGIAHSSWGTLTGSTGNGTEACLPFVLLTEGGHCTSYACRGWPSSHRVTGLAAKVLVGGRHVSRCREGLRRPAVVCSLLSPRRLAHPSDRTPSAISHTRTKRRMKVRIQRRLCPGKWSQVLW